MRRGHSDRPDRGRRGLLRRSASAWRHLPSRRRRGWRRCPAGGVSGLLRPPPRARRGGEPMTRGDTIPQVDGSTRYLYVCPRGTVAIDERSDGRREITRCTDGSGLTRRDIREAVALHEERARREEVTR